MNIEYKNKKISEYINGGEMKRKEPIIYKRFDEFRNDVFLHKNLSSLITSEQSYRIKKLSAQFDYMWSARLNNQYRVHFQVDNTKKINEITTIVVVEINDHQNY